MDNTLEKNVLDLTFQKNLIVASTTIGIIFAYVIAVIIGFLTQQIVFTSSSIIILVVISIVIFFLGVIIIRRAVREIRDIPLLIQSLK